MKSNIAENWNDESVVLETVQWSSLLDVDEVDPVGSDDHKVLKEIQKILKNNGALNRFGICLLHRHFDVNEGEIAVEYTDTENRISTVKVEPVKEIIDKSYLQTMWRFSDQPNSITVCVRRCSYNSGHRQIHVREGR